MNDPQTIERAARTILTGQADAREHAERTRVPEAR